MAFACCNLGIAAYNTAKKMKPFATILKNSKMKLVISVSGVITCRAMVNAIETEVLTVTTEVMTDRMKVNTIRATVNRNEIDVKTFITEVNTIGRLVKTFVTKV